MKCLSIIGGKKMYNNYYQPQTDERIWVQNEFAAEAYLVAPNSFVRLWDANKPVFYEKRADAVGRPLPMDVYEYKKKPIQPVLENNGTADYKEQIDGIMRRLDALERGSHANTESDADDTAV